MTAGTREAMTEYKNVLIPVNGSMRRLQEGLKIAANDRSWVTVLKVIPPYEGDIDLTGISNVREALHSDTSRTRRVLADAVRDEPAAKIRLEQGGLVETIRKVASEERSDLIILGAKKGAGPIRRRLDDSFIGRVKAATACQVMVIYS